MLAREPRYRFTVIGAGEFPIDMLRYDRCWPRRESGEIAASFRPRLRAALTIDIEGMNEPTRDRWTSFGWHVHNVEVVR